VTQALADGVLSELELLDLQEVADILGVEAPVLASLLSPPAAPPVAVDPAQRRGLVGKSVCFTGELCCRIGGARITRERAEELAAAAGLIVLRGVTKKLDILVLADPDTQSAKATKAREYGTRVMSDAVFFGATGIGVD
jgi:DNA polymerase-3 subunit epsilon